MTSQIGSIGRALRAVIVMSAFAIALCETACAEESVRVVPPPAADEAPGSRTGLETAVLAGGCFWGVEGVYQHVRGVHRVLSGYSGGDNSASYEEVGTGRTGHAESVEIKFDPKVVSYGKILQIFFSVAHDPTELNRQGPDTGTQYRSNIFAVDAVQTHIATAYIAQLNAAKAFSKPIVTRVDAFKAFYKAEDYHQDFLVNNPTYPYIVINDLPKIAALKRLFPDVYAETPVTGAGI